MKRQRDIERILDQWLLDGPRQVSDRVIDEVADQIARHPQSPAWRVSWRDNAMNLSTRWIAAVAAVLLIGAVVGIFVLNRPSQPVIGSTPSPGPSLSPTITAHAPVPTALRYAWLAGARPGALFDSGPFEPTIRIKDTTLESNDTTFEIQVPEGVMRSTVTIPAPDQFTLTLIHGEFGCRAGDAGTYAYTLTNGGLLMTVSVVSDPCTPRATTMPGPWARVPCFLCAGQLAAGTYSSLFFDPFAPERTPFGPAHPVVTGGRTFAYGRLTYTVPDGWSSSNDDSRRFELERWPHTDPYRSIEVFGDPAVTAQDSACSPMRQPGVGTSAGEIAGYIANLPGLTATVPEPITIGGLSGQMLDVAPASTWPACTRGVELFDLPLLREGDYQAGWEWSMSPDARSRLILLDLGAGKTVAVAIETISTLSSFDELVAQAMPIVQSFQFAR